MFQDKSIKRKSTEDNNCTDNKKLALELLGLQESRKRELKLAEKELLSLSILKRAHKSSDSLYKEVCVKISKCRKIYPTIADNLEVARKNIKTCDLINANHYEETQKKLHDYKNQSTQASAQLKMEKEPITLLRNKIKMKKLLELKKYKSEIVLKHGDLSTSTDKLNDELEKKKEENAGILKNIEKIESVKLNIQAEINKLDTDMKRIKENMTSIQILKENNAALLTKEDVELDKTVQNKFNNNSDLEKQINSLCDGKVRLEEENVNLSAIIEKANMECAEIEAVIKSEKEKQIDASQKNQLRCQEMHTLIKTLEDEHKLIINELLNKTELVQSLSSKLQKDEEINHNLEWNIAEMEINLVEVKEQIENDEKKYENMLSELKNLEQELDNSIEKSSRLNHNVTVLNDIYEYQIISLTNEARAIEMDIKYQRPVELQNISKMLDVKEREQATKDKLSVETAKAKLSDLRKQLEAIKFETKDVEKSLIPLDAEYNMMARKVNTLEQSNKMKKRAIQLDRKLKLTQPKKQRAERKRCLDAASTSSSSIVAPSIWEFEQMRKERRNKNYR